MGLAHGLRSAASLHLCAFALKTAAGFKMLSGVTVRDFCGIFAA
jgi:hypothetical protein